MADAQPRHRAASHQKLEARNQMPKMCATSGTVCGCGANRCAQFMSPFPSQNLILGHILAPVGSILVALGSPGAPKVAQ